MKPRGGKALLRLITFNAERGLDLGPRPLEITSEPARIAGTYAGVAEGLKSRFARRTPAPLAGVAAGPSPAPAAPAGPLWRSLGPVVMHNGQTYGSSRVDVSGRVSAIAVDPSDCNHILAGAAGGGVWESRDSGASWSARTDFMPTLTTGALAFDPSAPATVYCGTGEGNFYAGLGAGLLRSTDGGTTWAVHTSDPFVGVGFFDLLVDPADPMHLLAATTGGLFVSTNGGTMWTQALAARAWGLASHPSGGTAAEWLAACADGLYRSVDGGQSWTAVALPGAPASWDRLDVAIAKSNPAVAFAFGASGGTAYLFRRDGAGWQSIPIPGGLDTSQAWYDWYAVAAPDKDSQVYIGAIDLYRGDQDAGGNWGWTDLSTKTTGDSIHPDQHALVVDPSDPNTIYAGCDGGLFRSVDRGISWTALNNGLAITEIEYLAQDLASAQWLFAGTQDNGSTRYGGSPAWDHAADGDGGDCAVDQSNPNIVFHTFYGMGVERSTAKGDFGSFSPIGPNVSQGYQALFYPPVGCNQKTLTQAGESVFLSRDSGSTWTEVALPSGVVASAIAVPNPDHVFVGTTRGRLFHLSWSGSTWSHASELQQPRNDAWISRIWVDSNNLDRIWVTSSTIGGGRAFRSEDGGQHWTDYSTGLPSLPLNAVEVDPANPERVWIGADVGAYQSTDGGAHWSPFGSGLPNALVEDLLFHPPARLLRAGTRNRGVWEIAVDGEPAGRAAPMQGTHAKGTVPPNGEQPVSSPDWPVGAQVLWSVVPTGGPAGAPALTWQVSVAQSRPGYVTYWITVKNLTPVAIPFEVRFVVLSRG
jgi:photosystem II stability/assembly factor-like uncharacterized protein